MAGEQAMPPEELAQKDFAALRGVKPPMVTRWKQAGRLVMSSDGKRVRVAESITLLDASMDPGRGGDRSKPGALPGEAAACGGTFVRDLTGRSAGAGALDLGDSSSYRQAATREKLANAQRAELALAKEAGSLVNLAEAELAFARRVAAAKWPLLALPRRVAAELAGMTDPADVERFLSAEMQALCRLLAQLPAAAAPEQAE